MSILPLPLIAPACNKVFCDPGRPLLEGALNLNPTDCSIPMYIVAQKEIIKSITKAMTESGGFVSPCSQAENNAFCQWRNLEPFMYSVIYPWECDEFPLRGGVGQIIGCQPRTKKPSVFVGTTRCFGGFDQYTGIVKILECKPPEASSCESIRNVPEFVTLNPVLFLETALGYLNITAPICELLTDDQQCEQCMCEVVKQMELLLAKLT